MKRQPMVNKGITLNDIAKKAGVSPQTVSRVINNRPDVSRSTRQRIQQIINEMGYQPNAIARSLSTKRTWMIGVVIGSLDRYGPNRIFTELAKYTHLQGYRLLPYITHGENTVEIAKYIQELLTHRPDGIIWAVMERSGQDDVIHENFDGINIPLVTMEACMPDVPKPVFMDQVETADALTTHLIEQGYSNIGIITGELRSTTRGKLRISGWENALRRAGLPCTDLQRADSDWSATGGKQAMEQLIRKFPELDAVFACNDQMALGVLSYAHEYKIAVPSQLGVVGMDDVPEAACFNPPLTTARLPFEGFAEHTVYTLIQMINAHFEDEEYIAPETITLYPEIIIRESSLAKAGELKP